MRQRTNWLLSGLVLLALAGAGVLWWLTKPRPWDEAHWKGLGQPDLANGEQVFWAGGCTGCHAAPGAKDDQRLVLAGGRPLKSPFGTFYAPNISPDKTAGIGGWTLAEFGNAMTRGVGKDGEHLYPSFPYGSYARMTAKDINDLWGFLQTLPKSATVAPPHDLPFPYNIRLALGGWKLLYLTDDQRVALDTAEPKLARGQYLVEGPGHCGECHTPRDALGGFEPERWLAGAPNPEGEGRIPNITPGSKSIGGWSASDIASYLETGFTPDFDTVGGSMVEVQKNLAKLPSEDREAIAAYLKALPPL
ncbi:c-type cytochrome [Sinorhizobium alkalisoli]|uniref:c-type cytochrome n=1 Tax=Sinorhizobium alkalisoli TaxID=1752398 RepID=UPI00124C1002|nr:cytochrome c [Sinorhizobium alkalisoli]MCA1489678.1 cytochrome c [Ensifer sp. NBAIM29]QFI65480.1 Putative diheme cytochrome C-553 [Sinorhizobium alkalisoli]